jgi:hypothetical protein
MAADFADMLKRTRWYLHIFAYSIVSIILHCALQIVSNEQYEYSTT